MAKVPVRPYISGLGTILLKCCSIRISGLSVAILKAFYCIMPASAVKIYLLFVTNSSFHLKCHTECLCAILSGKWNQTS